MNSSLVSNYLSITDSSQVSEARRIIAGFAFDLGFDETLRGKLAIVVTELANNLVKHTSSGGGLIFRGLREVGRAGVEVLALDQGPGMRDLNQCMMDGYSTAGSPGTGLGAVRRLSSVFDIFSLLPSGTVILSQMWAPSGGEVRASRSPIFESGSICIPYRGEAQCGDAWELNLETHYSSLVVVDGLGHGLLAAEASAEAIRVFNAQSGKTLADILRAAHLAMRSTRGAAMAIARIDEGRSVLRYCGVGNISGSILTPGQHRRMVSHNGTVGLQIKKVNEFEYPWGKDSVLVMNTDGLTTQWGIEKYPGLLNRHSAVIAGVIYRDFQRGTDDATVVVMRATG